MIGESIGRLTSSLIEARGFNTSDLTMEMTMRKLTIIVIPLIAALTAQAATASERHHARAKDRAVLSEQIRNSNAYAAPGDFPARSYLRSEDNGAMASGLAGH
jgi:hypothetical protein